MNDNWIRILEIMNEDEILEYLKEEFEQSNIKYKIELEESWEGSIRNPKYNGKFVVYVQEGFESQVEKILNKYYESNETAIEEYDELQESNEIEDETELESKRIAKKQKNAIKIYVTIILFMIISIIVVALLA